MKVKLCEREREVTYANADRKINMQKRIFNKIKSSFSHHEMYSFEELSRRVLLHRDSLPVEFYEYFSYIEFVYFRTNC